MDIRRTRFQIALVLLVLPFLVKSQSYEKDGWELKKQESGIFVYTKLVPGSEFKAIKVFTNIKASTTSIIAILKDIPTYTSWVYTCRKSKRLAKTSETEQYYYIETAPPWPIRNRDVVVKSTFSQDPETKIVTSRFVSVDNYYPIVSGLVRITDMEGEYILVPKEDGSVDVHYELRVDPAGWLPAWLVNMAITIGPYRSFSKMKEMVMEEKNQPMTGAMH